jgi:hypothetical protein
MAESFWSDYTVEPKRKFRWLLSFRGVPQWIVKKVSKPNITITEAEHNFLNYKFYYPGRVEWAELTCTLVDPIYPDASKTMMEILKDSGYRDPADFDAGAPMTISKMSAVQAIGGRIYLQQLDPWGGVNEEWQLYNPWIKSISFDELDYESDDLLNVELTIRYDWARINNNVGGDIHSTALDKRIASVAQPIVNEGGGVGGV